MGLITILVWIRIIWATLAVLLLIALGIIVVLWQLQDETQQRRDSKTDTNQQPEKETDK